MISNVVALLIALATIGVSPDSGFSAIIGCPEGQAVRGLDFATRRPVCAGTGGVFKAVPIPDTPSDQPTAVLHLKVPDGFYTDIETVVSVGWIEPDVFVQAPDSDGTFVCTLPWIFTEDDWAREDTSRASGGKLNFVPISGGQGLTISCRVSEPPSRPLRAFVIDKDMFFRGNPAVVVQP
jgi:hypothetical protein